MFTEKYALLLFLEYWASLRTVCMYCFQRVCCHSLVPNDIWPAISNGCCGNWAGAPGGSGEYQQIESWTLQSISNPK